jgi:DNA-directed RNA polymerase subunit RPC12/RpoP
VRILAKCPKCGRIPEFGPEAADKRVRCPKCNRLFKIPDLESLERAMTVIDSAEGTVFVDQDGNVYG